jgi:hypothetical protein
MISSTPSFTQSVDLFSDCFQTGAIFQFTLPAFASGVQDKEMGMSTAISLRFLQH